MRDGVLYDTLTNVSRPGHSSILELPILFRLEGGRHLCGSAPCQLRASYGNLLRRYMLEVDAAQAVRYSLD